MVRVIWTDQAIEEVDRIAEYIAKDSLKYAKIQVSIFFQRVKILESHPLAGRIVPEFNIEEIRELIQGNYRIIYRVKSKSSILVLTVHSSHKRLSNLDVK